MSNTPDFSLVLSAEQLQSRLGDDELVIVDLQKIENYTRAHIPYAVNLDYNKLVSTQGKAGGLLPNTESVIQTMCELGISGHSHVVAYDAEGSAAAARLVWTLHVFGHAKASLLDGGLIRWANIQNPLENKLNATPPTLGDFNGAPSNKYKIDVDELLTRLGGGNLTIVDARTHDEYSGARAFATRAGRIPGAIHFEWSDALDLRNHYAFKPTDILLEMLSERAIAPENEIVVHCQTHRRSSLSYVMLRHLGYDNVRGYHGSWSEWGNRNDTPIEC